MNIIVTGVTTEMTKGSSRVGFAPFSGALVEVCEALGHTVRMQRMNVDTNAEDLEWADVMICGISPFNSIGSRFMFGMLDAIGQARKHNCGLLFCVSDWQTHLIHSSVRAILKKPENMTKWFMRNRTDFTWGVHHIEYLTRIIRAFHDRPWPATIVPVMGWFDYSNPNAKNLLDTIPARKHVMMDPTPFTTALWEIPRKPPEEKSREYVLSALGDYSRWLDEQNVSWPVRAFGSKTLVLNENGEKVLVTNKQIKEWEVNEQYAETWIGLSPKHRLSGTAWWRSRYHNILRAGSVLYGDPQETTLIGDAFGHSIEQLEAMSTEELAELNERQMAQFNEKTKTREEVMVVIQDALDGARAELA